MITFPYCINKFRPNFKKQPSRIYIVSGFGIAQSPLPLRIIGTRPCAVFSPKPQGLNLTSGSCELLTGRVRGGGGRGGEAQSVKTMEGSTIDTAPTITRCSQQVLPALRTHQPLRLIQSDDLEEDLVNSWASMAAVWLYVKVKVLKVSDLS